MAICTLEHGEEEYDIKLDQKVDFVLTFASMFKRLLCLTSVRQLINFISNDAICVVATFVFNKMLTWLDVSEFGSNCLFSVK